MKTAYYILIIIGVFLLQECAQISAPTGGEKDETPPTLDSIGTIPLNYSTNFNSDRLVLQFNEYFVLKNPTSNVFFSPSLENDPEFITKGKTLTILLKNKLKLNTTYTINFGDAISDYTVGNKIPDFKYVFSTGEFIDSMSTAGTVIDAFTGKPMKNVLVMLYQDKSDSVVFNSKPDYYGKTNEKGEYNLDYIKADSYKIISLKDENRNFKYDLPNEKIGFSKQNLDLNDTNNQSKLIISLFEKDHIKQSIKSKKYLFPGKLIFTFARPVNKISFTKESGDSISYHSREISKKRDSIVLWKPTIQNNKNIITVTIDSITSKENVFGFNIPKKKIGLKKLIAVQAIDVNDIFKISFDRPLDTFRSNYISIYKDSTSIEFSTPRISNNDILLTFDKKEGDNYRYQILPNAITDIFGKLNPDTISGFISIRKSDFYGSFSLKFNPKNDSTQFLVYLLNEKGIVIDEKYVTGFSELKFEKLSPAKYNVKAILDKNGNGKWDTGNYYQGLQPDPVFFFPVPIEVRSNWEISETWKF